MNAGRLLALASHLEGVPEDAFRMNHWFQKTECGTVACAMGHACDIAAFQAAGLERLPYSYNGYGSDTVTYAGRKGFWAAATLFDISYTDAVCLFDGDEYDEPTKSAVIERLREFVAARDRRER